MTTAEYPWRLSVNDVAAPAGPPPRTATPTSRISLRLNIIGAPLHDETKLVPIVDHFVGIVNVLASPWLLGAAAFGVYIVRSLRGPPSVVAVLSAIIKVGLPRHCHLLGYVAWHEQRSVETKGFREFVGVAQSPAGFNTWVKRSTYARLQS